MKIHPLSLIYLLLAFMFHMNNYIIFLLFSLLHEIGHYFIALYFHFDIEYIMVLPFGAFLALNDFGKHQVIEEILMLVAGPLVNLFFIFVFFLFQQRYLMIVNLFICIFNLIPIYPLDGSKILHLYLSYFFNYEFCFQIQIKISILLIAAGFVCFRSIGKIMVLIYLFYQTILYMKNYRYIVIETILSDHNYKKKIKLNRQLKYYRPYVNYYYFHDQLYDLELVKMNLIKSMKSH